MSASHGKLSFTQLYENKIVTSFVTKLYTPKCISNKKQKTAYTCMLKCSPWEVTYVLSLNNSRPRQPVGCCLCPFCLFKIACFTVLCYTCNVLNIFALPHLIIIDWDHIIILDVHFPVLYKHGYLHTFKNKFM